MNSGLTGISTLDLLAYLWQTLDLPRDALKSVSLTGGDNIAAPSSFRIGHLAQSSIALSGLIAALIYAGRSGSVVHHVTVDRKHAVAEFNSEKLYLLNGKAPLFEKSIGGLHRTQDGYVRIHDGFPNHRDAALQLLGCQLNATPAEFAEKVASRTYLELERDAIDAGAVIYAMRSFEEWDLTAQAQAVQKFPITITKVADSEPVSFLKGSDTSKKCLSGIRVLEMSRVVAAPVAGRTLAAHGADVLWITSPNLPDLPVLDVDFGRGKRTAQLDINQAGDKERLLTLLQDADVFLQSYRPGSLAGKGLDIRSLLTQRDNKPIVCANLSAWGADGPWSHRRGFDSIVQTVSGMNVSEAHHYGSGEARIMPCQALDHGAGYFLASGIMTALYRQMTEGGSYQVDISLAGVARHLRSLGQYDNNSGFRGEELRNVADVPDSFTETRYCAFGKLQAIKHSVSIDAIEVGWEEMPKPLGSDDAVWC